MKRHSTRTVALAAAMTLCVAIAGCDPNPDAPSAPTISPGSVPPAASTAPGVMPAKVKTKNGVRAGAQAASAD